MGGVLDLSINNLATLPTTFINLEGCTVFLARNPVCDTVEKMDDLDMKLHGLEVVSEYVRIPVVDR